MTYPYTEVVYQRAGGTEYVVSNPVKGAAIQPEDWLPTDDAVVYEVWIRTHLSASSVHNSEKTSVTLYNAASGGTVTTFTGDGTNGTNGVVYRVHRFTSDGNLVVRYPRTVDHLIVGGGGGGGTRHGGGGGAGGVLSGSANRAADTYAVTVGAGGRGFVSNATSSTSESQRAASGASSSVFSLTANGGGRGGSGASLGGSETGGSGGGSQSGTGSAGTSGQGNTGGTGSNSNWSGGGGGGAGSAGGNSTPTGNVTGGSGGSGVASTITGTSVTYAGGGGGSVAHYETGGAGRGGTGGGGAGGHLGWTIYNIDGIGATYPANKSEMDSLFSSATVSSQRTSEITTQSSTATANILNWDSASTLETVTGVTVPNSGVQFALRVMGTFVATETGTYTFTIAGDDSVDLLINGNLVASHYGTHATGDLGVNTGTVSMTAGQTYRFMARQQERTGGEGLRVFWRKPSQTTGWHQDASELSAAGRNGTDGLGGGGGAGGHVDVDSTFYNAASGRGGNGVVIVRYPVSA